MKHLFSVLLAVVLALTSQSMAVARGANAATGQMVLCTGSGPMAIYVDAQGAPTSAPHICPDSALNVLADFDLPVVLAPQTLLQVSAQIGLSALALPDHPAVVPPSRGPPLSI